MYRYGTKKKKKIASHNTRPTNISRSLSHSPKEEKEIREQVQNLLQTGIIKNSYFPYLSPIPLVYKCLLRDGRVLILILIFKKSLI